jgi:hypothetical protein
MQVYLDSRSALKNLPNIAIIPQLRYLQNTGINIPPKKNIMAKPATIKTSSIMASGSDKYLSTHRFNTLIMHSPKYSNIYLHLAMTVLIYAHAVW